MSKRWHRASFSAMSGIPWSNEEHSLKNFVLEHQPPQVVKVKKDGKLLKSSVELVLHETKSQKKIEGCLVSEGETFVLPYDCTAKVYQLSKAEEYRTLNELRKALPTCRFFLITSKPKDEQLQAIERGEVLTIVFKKTISGGDVFTCERKKIGAKIDVKGNAEGGFAPMGTTNERKINEFVRSYSTFPIGIGLTQSTLTNKAFASLNDLIMKSSSGLIRLTRLLTVDSVIASSLGKKVVYCIPNGLDFKVIPSKALLQGNAEHKDLCRKFNEDVDKDKIYTRLNTSVTFGNPETELVQWVYGEESYYDVVGSFIPSGRSQRSSVLIRGSALERGTNSNSEEKNSEKKKKVDDKEKNKDLKSNNKKSKEGKEKEKVANKENKTKELKKEKIDGKKSKAIEKASKNDESVPQPLEDDSGYLVPAELLRAEKQDAKVEKAEKIDKNEKVDKTSKTDKNEKVDKTSKTDKNEKVDKTSKTEKTTKLDKTDKNGERGSIGLTLGRFMGLKKGKHDKKKGERPVIEVLHSYLEEPQTSSSTMQESTKLEKPQDSKNTGNGVSASQLNEESDKTDGQPSNVKEEKKGKSTLGRKGGKKMRDFFSKNQPMDDEPSKSSSHTSSTLPPSPSNKEFTDEPDMYVIPVDDEKESSSPTSLCDRELPELPPTEPRHKSSASDEATFNDDDNLYDEIAPVQKKTFKIPKDLSKLSTNEISDVLRAVNMTEHISKFRKEQIDGEIFKALDEKTLGALGVVDPLQRLKIKKLLKGWRPKS